MNEEKNGKNSSWIGRFSCILIILIFGFTVIYSYKTDVDVLKKFTKQIDDQNKIQEMRIIKLEACYDNVRDSLNEIKSDIKDIKKMTLERIK